MSEQTIQGEGKTMGTAQTAELTPFVPQFMEQAIATANLVARSNLIPAHLRGKPSDVLVTIMTGYEYGFSPMQAMREIYLVDGKPAFSATALMAMCLRSREVCEYFRQVESDEKHATFETKRRGDPAPTRLTFTIEQATKAKLTGKDNWQKYPAAMLCRRCSTHLARNVYPDLIMGAVEADEAEELEVNRPPLRVAPPPPPATVVAAPAVAPDPKAPATETPAAAPAAQQTVPGNDIDPVSDFDKLLAAIGEAQTVDHLEKLKDRLHKLSREDQVAIKPHYDEKKAELAKAGQ